MKVARWREEEGGARGVGDVKSFVCMWHLYCAYVTTRRPLSLQRVCFLEEISLKKLFQSSSSSRYGLTSSNLFKTLSFQNPTSVSTSPHLHLLQLTSSATTSTSSAPTFIVDHLLHRSPSTTASSVDTCRLHLLRRPPPRPSTSTICYSNRR
ncbi:hypothetical protein HanIR_Chr13g0649691 [Helianthus annuus]|nr:hypothetical protein HanIR_Chr13g0649691 [Helianthus annuus]